MQHILIDELMFVGANASGIDLSYVEDELDMLWEEVCLPFAGAMKIRLMGV